MAGSKGSKYYDVFLKFEVWLEKNSGEIILDKEVFKLLEWIDKSGSLMAAAEKCNISYRKAWGKIKETEKKLQICLVKRTRGGENGGKSMLSDDGKNIFQAYNELTKEIDDSIYKITKKFFHTINS